jgi:hypothetical protein
LAEICEQLYFVLFNGSKAKQSKASKQSYESELFNSLINTNKAVIAHHCCLQDLAEGMNQRSALFLYRT